MKFFHVYNDKFFEGLEKNGMINRDTGFKIQHVFSMPDEIKFNQYAAKGTKLHSLIKDEKFPFYVDRIAGGCTYHKYSFDRSLIREYKDILGDWFLGFQLHESGSNRCYTDWPRILHYTGGDKGPYDPEVLRKVLKEEYAVMPDGTPLQCISQGTVEEYAKLQFPETPQAYIADMMEMFRTRMGEVEGSILPCDSYFMATKMQDELGMRSFMPEVGCQIPLMRLAVALVRGIAKASGKTWGTYYECWREVQNVGYSMPCFNDDPSNEWYLSQELHPDDFTSYGENGGSSRLLQNRIYYYSLMSGADYFSEEWGLNCSYSDMKEFSLSPYGMIKKNFISAAEKLRGIQAEIPFAIVLPKAYSCVEIPSVFWEWEVGLHREKYMERLLGKEEREYVGHVEDVLKLFFVRNGKKYGNEGHVITNSRFGDVVDVIYEDTSMEAMKKYEYLIDATPDSEFFKKHADSGMRILESADLERLTSSMDQLIRATMPCVVDKLCWLVSTDQDGRRFLSIFNNEGNERDWHQGDIIHTEADEVVTVQFSIPANVKVFEASPKMAQITREDDLTYRVKVPAAGFVILEF